MRLRMVFETLSILVLLAAFSSCAREVKVLKPQQTAYRFTRADEVQCIMKFPNGAVSLHNLKKECGCLTQTCLIEVIKMTHTDLPPVK